MKDPMLVSTHEQKVKKKAQTSWYKLSMRQRETKKKKKMLGILSRTEFGVCV